MNRSLPGRRLLAGALGLAALILGSPAADVTASPLTQNVIPASKMTHGHATFALAALRHRRVQSARLVVGHRSRRIRAGALREGIRRGRITLRVRRSATRRPTLLVTTRRRPATAATAATKTFGATADTFVSAARPSASFGRETSLKVDGSPALRGFVRFDVEGLTGTVTRARLRLYSNSLTGTGLRAHALASGFTESTTWSTAPALGGVVGSSESFQASAWMSVDVTPLVKGDGAVSIGLSTTSSSSKLLRSRETSYVPQLVVETETATATEPAPEPAPAPDPTRDAPAPAPSGGVEPGIAGHLLWGSVSSAEQDAQLDKAQAAGAKVIRVDAGWTSLQLRGDTFDSSYVAKIGSVVEKIAARGMKPLLMLWRTPCWASSDPTPADCSGSYWDTDTVYYPPRDPQQFADVAEHLLRQPWGSKIAYLEVWNEPNGNQWFKVPGCGTSYPGDFDCLARGFVPMQQAVYQRAKAVMPSTQVVAAGMMHADYRFTRSLYAAGLKGSMDLLGIHPYSENRGPLAAPSKGWEFVSYSVGVPMVRAVMEEYGDTASRIAFTEFGWNTKAPTCSGATWCLPVTEAQQATYVQQAIDYAQAEWNYVGPVIVYRTKDGTGTSHVDYFGMWRADGTAKPAVEAFRAAAAG